MTTAMTTTVTPEHVTRLRRRVRLAAGLAIVLLFALLSTMLVATLVNTVRNGTTAATVRDCTAPGGTCYERNRKATRDAVQELVASIRHHDRLSDARTRQLLAHIDQACGG